ncbi:MAG: thioesterase family protein [Archangiaceae bacterium]|nr:thioesterase family protein [Archangiaceae bacterium]
MTTTFDAEPIAQVLSGASSTNRFSLGRSLWTFSGAHGGLVLAMLTAAMRQRAPGRQLRQVTGQFRRPLRSEFELEVVDDGVGKTVTWLSAHAKAKGGAAVSANAVFAQHALELAPFAPQMPPAPPPSECPVFTVPEDFVPFSRRTEIRPVGSARPYSGGEQPELVTWLRFVDDDLPLDDERLIVLMDSLAPSYAAVLSALAPIPTVTFSVTPGAGLARASSPWLLLRARTEVSRGDGWLIERLDAWAPDGAHLGSGEQLRLVMSAP